MLKMLPQSCGSALTDRSLNLQVKRTHVFVREHVLIPVRLDIATSPVGIPAQCIHHPSAGILTVREQVGNFSCSVTRARSAIPTRPETQ